jgi:glutamate-1-semialdehyde 2,1-aminomutase
MSSESRYKESAALLERSKKVLAGGVASEFRKFNYPHALFYTHGNGSRIYDADGNEYLDFTLSQGPLILGHSHPQVLESINNYSAKGQLFAGQHLQEVQLAEKIQELIPSAERMRFCLDGSEAVQTAFRVARATTGRQKILRFEGHYHGWLDNVCWGNAAPSLESLGSREHPSVVPWSQGLPENSGDEIILLPWNDLELVEKTLVEKGHEIAAIITEPVMCNNGCIAPREGYLQGLRKLCDDYGIALIFDEVITGFRIGLRGAQSHYNVIPDISIFAKAMASGYPISVIAGKQKWMQVIEEGKVIHAGTMNSGNAPVAAALATLQVLEQTDPYNNMYALGQELMNGLQKIARDLNLPLLVQGLGPMFHTGFTNLTRVKEYRDTFSYDKIRLQKFIAGMHDKGIRIIGRGLWYISAAHTSDDIAYALQKAREVLGNMN